MQKLSYRIVVSAAVLALAAACSAQNDTAAPQQTQAAPATPLDTVAGLPLTGGPSGMRDGVPVADIAVENATTAQADVLAINAVADLEEYWKVEYPKVFRSEFTPVSRYFSWDSNVTEGAPTWCGLDTSGFANAKYCLEELPADSIGWDRGILLPYLIDSFGPIATVMVLAHEYGHAVQFHGSLISAETIDTSILVSEQQADCFAGAFMRHVAEGKAEHFTLDTTDGLDSVLLTALDLRDGDYGPQQGEHGSGFDRVSALKIGFTDGPGACTAISAQEIADRRGDLPQILSGPDDTGEAPITQDTVDALTASLATLFPLVDPPAIDYSGTPGDCPDGVVTRAASYCPTTNTIGVDLRALGRRADSTKEGDANAFGLVASRYALAVQNQNGRAIDDPLAGLRAACLTGAWAASSIGDPEFQLSPGDLDEIVAGLLADGLVASDIHGDAAQSGFTRIDAFQTGVLDGRTGCDASFT